MITLKLGSYNPEECEELSTILRNTAHKICDERGSAGKCNLCPVRKICNDLAKAASFAHDQSFHKYNSK